MRGLLDCGGDDYFNPAPRPGTWLAEHPEHNAAQSPFLGAGGPQPDEAPFGVLVPPYVRLDEDGKTWLPWGPLGSGVDRRAVTWSTATPGCAVHEGASSQEVRCEVGVAGNVLEATAALPDGRQLVVRAPIVAHSADPGD